uniref:ANK_REP_REGION domain-containing protein n=1 Tax=Macrostomum lignano TaxID=282301 RepID=A0A1I8JPH3_9PLAT
SPSSCRSGGRRYARRLEEVRTSQPTARRQQLGEDVQQERATRAAVSELSSKPPPRGCGVRSVLLGSVPTAMSTGWTNFTLRLPGVRIRPQPCRFSTSPQAPTRRPTCAPNSRGAWALARRHGISGVDWATHNPVGHLVRLRQPPVASRSRWRGAKVDGKADSESVECHGIQICRKLKRPRRRQPLTAAGGCCPKLEAMAAAEAAFPSWSSSSPFDLGRTAPPLVTLCSMAGGLRTRASSGPQERKPAPNSVDDEKPEKSERNAARAGGAWSAERYAGWPSTEPLKDIRLSLPLRQRPLDDEWKRLSSWLSSGSSIASLNDPEPRPSDAKDGDGRRGGRRAVQSAPEAGPDLRKFEPAAKLLSLRTLLAARSGRWCRRWCIAARSVQTRPATVPWRGRFVAIQDPGRSVRLPAARQPWQRQRLPMTTKMFVVLDGVKRDAADADAVVEDDDEELDQGEAVYGQRAGPVSRGRPADEAFATAPMSSEKSLLTGQAEPADDADDETRRRRRTTSTGTTTTEAWPMTIGPRDEDVDRKGGRLRARAGTGPSVSRVETERRVKSVLLSDQHSQLYYDKIMNAYYSTIIQINRLFLLLLINRIFSAVSPVSSIYEFVATRWLPTVGTGSLSFAHVLNSWNVCASPVRCKALLFDESLSPLLVPASSATKSGVFSPSAHTLAGAAAGAGTGRSDCPNRFPLGGESDVDYANGDSYFAVAASDRLLAWRVTDQGAAHDVDQDDSFVGPGPVSASLHRYNRYCSACGGLTEIADAGHRSEAPSSLVTGAVELRSAQLPVGQKRPAFPPHGCPAWAGSLRAGESHGGHASGERLAMEVGL